MEGKIMHFKVKRWSLHPFMSDPFNFVAVFAHVKVGK